MPQAPASSAPVDFSKYQSVPVVKQPQPIPSYGALSTPASAPAVPIDFSKYQSTPVLKTATPAPASNYGVLTNPTPAPVNFTPVQPLVRTPIIAQEQLPASLYDQVANIQAAKIMTPTLIGSGGSTPMSTPTSSLFTKLTAPVLDKIVSIYNNTAIPEIIQGAKTGNFQPYLQKIESGNLPGMDQDPKTWTTEQKNSVIALVMGFTGNEAASGEVNIPAGTKIWQQNGFDTKAEYTAALKDVSANSESDISNVPSQILSGKITFKPSTTDSTEWKDILGSRYYAIFKKSAPMTVDAKASELGYASSDELRQAVADESYDRFNSKLSVPKGGVEPPTPAVSKQRSTGELPGLTKEPTIAPTPAQLKKPADVVGSISSKRFGRIDLRVGEVPTGHSTGYGQAKIAGKGDFTNKQIMDLIDTLPVKSDSANRTILEDDKYRVIIGKNWFGQESKPWLANVFPKDEPVRQAGIEPATSPVSGERSTVEPLAPAYNSIPTGERKEVINTPPGANHTPSTGETGSGTTPPTPPRKTGIPPPAGEPAEPNISSPQTTTNKVQFTVKGTTEGERVTSAKVNAERAKQEISIRGKNAAQAGAQLSPGDLKLVEKYESGTPTEDIVKQAQNPKQVQSFLTKLEDYYDFRLAADRAAGGSTKRVEDYIPHSWDLSKPADLERFNELAKQKGLQPYDGYRAQPRVFDTYAQGEAAGFSRLRPNILEDLKVDYKGASGAISKQVLRTGLAEAAPSKVSLSGAGVTDTGKPFVNSNIQGLEGISYHPDISRQLKSYEPLNGVDVFNLIGEKGFDIKSPATYSKVWDGLKEGGVLNTAGTLYDRATTPFKHFLLNFSGFHSINVSSNFAGASIFNPIKGTEGLGASVPAFMSEGTTSKIIDGFKENLPGKEYSSFDWGLQSGVNMDRNLPLKPLTKSTSLADVATKVNPFTALGRAMFDRELYTMKLNLVEQAAKKGIEPGSPQAIRVGQQINRIMGELNVHVENINPNTMKFFSRLLLAPQFTVSKYKLIGSALSEGGAAGNLARKAVIGKSIVMGTIATLGTLLATGKFPDLQQLLLNYTVNPTSQTNQTNPKGQKQDITYPQTFVTEPIGAIRDPIHYGEARLSPALSTGIKAVANQDYYGRPIVDPNVKESAVQQRWQNLGIGTLPIGIQQLFNKALGKQTTFQSALGVIGLRTRTSASDPTQVGYAQLDKAKAGIDAIDPADPDRVQKIQDIFSGLASSSRRSLAYQLLMEGVSTKGVAQSDAGVLFNKVQILKAAGDTAGLKSIADTMTPAEQKAYTVYKEGYDTKTLKSLLQSDPAKAVQFARSLDPAEQTRITKLLKLKANADLMQLYMQGKSQL